MAKLRPVFTNDTTAHTLTFDDSFGHNSQIGTYSPATGAFSTNVSSGTFPGDVSIAGTLNAIGAATFSGTASAPHFNTTNAGNLQFGGLATVGIYGDASNISIRPPGVGGGVYIQASGGTAYAPLFAGAAAFTGVLGASGAVSLGSTLGVTGATAMVGALSVGGVVSGTGFTNRFASPGPIGNTAASTGAFTTLTASSTVTGSAFIANVAGLPQFGGNADVGVYTDGLNIAIRAPQAGGSVYAQNATGASLAPFISAGINCTTLAASSTVSGAGFTTRFSSPGPIGNTTPSTGAFTKVSGIYEDLQGASPGNQTVYPTIANRTYLSGSGAIIAKQDITGYIGSTSTPAYPDAAYDTAANYMRMTTSKDAGQGEATLVLNTTIGTGALEYWAPITVYAVGDCVINAGQFGEVFRCTQAGTSAAGAGNYPVTHAPTGPFTGIVDGTCRWTFVNAAALAYKAGIYNGVVTTAGAGPTWAQANNLIVGTGFAGGFAVNTELDLSNFDVDSTIGTGVKNTLFVTSAGPNTSSAVIAVYGTTDDTIGSPFSCLFGITVGGAKVSKHSAIEISATGERAIGIGAVLGGAAHSVAGIEEASTSPVGVSLHGTYSDAAIKINSILATNAGVTVAGSVNLAFYTSGTSSFADFSTARTSPVGFDALGSTHSLGDFRGASYAYIARTYGTLPAVGPAIDQVFLITDCNTAVFNAVAAGGGSNRMNVRSNGTNWRVSG